jgi:signal transduction histidine kinase
VVERQLRLMRRQVGRMRDLRRFVSDALQGLPDATFVVSAQGRIMMTSTAGDALLTALKLDPNERSIGAVFQRLSSAADDNAPPLSLGEAAAEVVAPNGARYQLGQSPILSHDGEALGWIVRLGDISEIRAAQERREEILQLLTHDMRSPQASILALLDEAGAKAPAAPIAGRIRALAQRTLSLADAYVRLSRAESAHLKLEALDGADVLVEAVDAVWPQAQAKGVTLTATPDDEALMQADRSLVTRALINLIDNAVRHAPSGSAVVCRVEPAEGEIAFVVQDHGPGLEPERIASLFKRFGAVGSAAVKSGGVGLGLALVRATALRHGGRIECHSRPGDGATFRLILPRSAPLSD